MTISASRALRSRNHLCSYRCRGLWYSRHYSGANSPQYRDGQSGKTTYGRWWRSTSKAVLERDGHKCAACGCDENRLLVVHHIIPAYELIQSGPPGSITDQSNLITVCRTCHGKIHGNDDCFPDGEIGGRLRAYIDEHPDWFRGTDTASIPACAGITDG